MPQRKPYLLDTNVLLHWIRGSQVAKNINTQFGLQSSSFRPLVCEVTLGEIAAFAHSSSWSAEKRKKLNELKKKLVAVDISDYRVIEAYAEFSSLSKSSALAIFNDKNDLWIAAAARVSGATLLTTDQTAFRPLLDGKHLDVILLDAKTGWKLA